MVVERLFDILLLLVLAFLIVVTGDSWQALRMRGALVYGGIVCAGLLALLLLVRHQSASMIRAGARLQDTRSMSVKRLAGAVSSFAAGLDCLSREDIGAMVLSVATSAAVWMCTLINIASGAKALNLSLPLSLSLPIMLVQSAGMLVPSGPANIGVFQFSTVASLAPFDVTKTTALGLSLVLHATRFFPTTLIGLAYFVARLHRRARRPSLQLKEY